MPLLNRARVPLTVRRVPLRIAVALVMAVSAATGCSGHSTPPRVACPSASAVDQHADVAHPLKCPQVIGPRLIRYIYTGGPGCVLTRDVAVPNPQSVVVNLQDASACRDSLVVGPENLDLPRPVTEDGNVELTVHYTTFGKTIDYKTAVTNGS